MTCSSDRACIVPVANQTAIGDLGLATLTLGTVVSRRASGQASAGRAISPSSWPISVSRKSIWRREPSRVSRRGVLAPELGGDLVGGQQQLERRAAWRLDQDVG